MTERKTQPTLKNIGEIFQGANTQYAGDREHTQFLDSIIDKLRKYDLDDVIDFVLAVRRKYLERPEQATRDEISFIQLTYLGFNYAPDLAAANEELEAGTLDIIEDVYGDVVDEIMYNYQFDDSYRPQFIDAARTFATLKWKMTSGNPPNKEEVERKLEDAARNVAES